MALTEGRGLIAGAMYDMACMEHVQYDKPYRHTSVWAQFAHSDPLKTARGRKETAGQLIELKINRVQIGKINLNR